MRGIDADALQKVIVSDDGERVRIIFEQTGNEFYFEADLAAMRALMPHLAAVTNPKGPLVTSIPITAVDAAEDFEGVLLLTLTNTAGARMTFELPRDLAARLHELVDEHLSPPQGSNPVAH